MSRCRSCGALVDWATSATTGRRIPLDPHDVPPATPGALVVVNDSAYTPGELAERMSLSRGISTTRALEVIAAEEWPHHIAHFATCPYADTHRRRYP